MSPIVKPIILARNISYGVNVSSTNRKKYIAMKLMMRIDMSSNFIVYLQYSDEGVPFNAVQISNV